MHAPSSEACNGKVYDFFVVCKSMSDFVQCTFAIGDAGLNPHSAARIVIRGIPRKIMARMLKAPTPLPAVLPHGPMMRQDEEWDMVAHHYKPLDVQFSDLVRHTSTTLGSLAGHDLGKAGSGSEWCDGPKFVWRNVATPRPRTTLGPRRYPGHGGGRRRG